MLKLLGELGLQLLQEGGIVLVAMFLLWRLVRWVLTGQTGRNTIRVNMRSGPRYSASTAVLFLLCWLLLFVLNACGFLW